MANNVNLLLGRFKRYENLDTSKKVFMSIPSNNPLRHGNGRRNKRSGGNCGGGDRGGKKQNWVGLKRTALSMSTGEVPTTTTAPQSASSMMRWAITKQWPVARAVTVVAVTAAIPHPAQTVTKNTIQSCLP